MALPHPRPHLWLIDPLQHSVETYELRDGQYELTARGAGEESFTPLLFPGLTIPLRSLWEPW
ncbi:MAG: Uma2 family endonuclease [Chloroflexi bacterium]|nr:Uma2 family endonuclease [Chloroflexota bacterium]